MIERKININADLGEGATNDALIMPLIASCNIACGGHAGDQKTMEDTIALAQKHQVQIGAHPSYPDRENFGRSTINILPEQLQKSLEEQLSMFKEIAVKQNATIHHVKPHGALYNNAAKSATLSKTIIGAIQNVLGKTKVYAPPGSILEKIAKKSGHDVFPEAFIDRQYQQDGSLVSRKEAGALITDERIAWEQLKNMIASQQIQTITGQMIPMQASTFCIHGDQENAVAILEFIHQKARQINWSIA